MDQDHNQNKPIGTKTKLFDLIWDDILLECIFPYLTIKDLFNLRCCSRLSEEFVDCCFRKITRVNFSGIVDKHTKYAFEVLAKKCGNVRELNLAKCGWLTNSQLLPMLKNNISLETVNLNECNSITAVALQPVIINCKQLKKLSLSKCYWLTVGSVNALILHQRNLEELNISHCNTIGPKVLYILCRYLENLKILSMAYLSCVSDAILVVIAKNCIKIRHLCLVGCDRITDEGVEYVFFYQ